MTESSRSTGKPPARSATRVSIEQPARLVGEYGRTIDVVLVDVSKEGFRVRANAPIPGEPTILRVARQGDLRIEIRWVRGLEAGGVFLDRPTAVD